MTEHDEWLSNVRARYDLARMAGEDADEHNEPWTGDPRFRTIVRSWRDVADLHDALRRTGTAPESECGACLTDENGRVVLVACSKVLGHPGTHGGYMEAFGNGGHRSASVAWVVDE